MSIIIPDTKTPANAFNFDALQDFFSASDEPRFLVIIANSILELYVNAVIGNSCKNGPIIITDSRTYPYGGKLVLLNEVGLLDDNQFQMLRVFKNLRNDAAHEPIFKLTRKKLEPFKDLKHPGKRMDMQAPASFMFVCYYLVFGFFESHKKAITDYLDGEAFQTRKAKLLQE
jgi:hypothetical protein